MRVSLREGAGPKLEERLSFRYHEGAVNIDSKDLVGGAEYVIRYDFYEREKQASRVSGCQQTYITQQLLIAEEGAMKARVREWENEESHGIPKLMEGAQCNF